MSVKFNQWDIDWLKEWGLDDGQIIEFEKRIVAVAKEKIIGSVDIGHDISEATTLKESDSFIINAE